MMNHFPGMVNIYRKNLLGRNLNKIKERMPEIFEFYPLTWTMPTDRLKFKMDMANKDGKEQYFIIKPEDSAQGKGIMIFEGANKVPTSRRCIVQEYLHEYKVNNLLGL